MAKNTTKKITSIGGSALIEGIMMRGPKRTTVCVRTAPDKIYSEDISINTIPSKCKLFKLPFLRGIAGLIDSMRLSYKALMLSADKAIESTEIEEEPSKFEKWLDDKFGDKLVKVRQSSVLRLPWDFSSLSPLSCLTSVQMLCRLSRVTAETLFSGSLFLRVFSRLFFSYFIL